MAGMANSSQQMTFSAPDPAALEALRFAAIILCFTIPLAIAIALALIWSRPR